MTAPNKKTSSDWLNAFLPLGQMDGENWTPLGGGVLLIDNPLVWLVTATEVISTIGQNDLSTWVPTEKGASLLNITDSQRGAGITWIHSSAGISATLFPLDPSFAIKAFSEAQCARVADLAPMQPTISIGALYSSDIAAASHPTTAACDGVVSATSAHTGEIYSTAPLLPRNVGGPLLLASPYGGAASLAGVILGNVTIAETDPRALPVRLSRAMCTNAVMELVRSEDAKAHQRTITERPTNSAQTQQPEEGDA